MTPLKILVGASILFYLVARSTESVGFRVSASSAMWVFIFAALSVFANKKIAEAKSISLWKTVRVIGLILMFLAIGLEIMNGSFSEHPLLPFISLLAPMIAMARPSATKGPGHIDG